jgi:radical SAM superfamily enzyme YgiQ (UPF0313 family)
MRAMLIQPPFVQLNAPYPAVYFLESFIRSRGMDASAFDHSIALYRSIFSREGLARIFRDAADSPAAREPPDTETRRQLARYFSYRDLYLQWVDEIVDFLSGGNHGFAHRLAQAAEFPRGQRAEDFLDASGGRVGPDDARALATRILEDLGDFVSFTLDPEFATVRYGERLARAVKEFDTVERALSGAYLMHAFYRPLLRTFFASAEPAGRIDAGTPDLVLVTIPFPGCLPGALVAAQEARAAFGARTRIVFGGGYVSTELRSVKEGKVFDYCDYLSFDAGYGSLASILEVESGAPKESLYRTMYRDAEGRVRTAGFGVTGPFHQLEQHALAEVFPDYRGVDFTAYLSVVDSDNPMHRLWSDTPWLKYRLAHGCYWKRCTFCDTELDYVARYVPAELSTLAAAADAASSRTGIYGIHFVDEAVPVAKLLQFARINRERSAAGARPFHFWGNVRFDTSWTADRCELLAASGLVAVSGGVEIATEKGLEMTDKGFDFSGLVRTLVAMKRAGLLVHAYLIYGYPGQKERDVVDSAEAVRQLFASGLVDSAFWHRFILGRHSRMYAEWKAGTRPSLRPIDPGGTFADNDLGFEGENLFDRFSAPLESALDAWMEGSELDRPAASWFKETAAKRSRGREEGSTIAAGFVEGLIAETEKALDAVPAEPRPVQPAFWVAGLPVVERPLPDGLPGRLSWTCRGGAQELRLPSPAAESLARAIEVLSRAPAGMPWSALAAQAGLAASYLPALRGVGLVVP